MDTGLLLIPATEVRRWRLPPIAGLPAALSTIPPFAAPGVGGIAILPVAQAMTRSTAMFIRMAFAYSGQRAFVPVESVIHTIGHFLTTDAVESLPLTAWQCVVSKFQQDRTDLTDSELCCKLNVFSNTDVYHDVYTFLA